MITCHCCNQQVKTENETYRGIWIVHRNAMSAKLMEANETLKKLQIIKVQSGKQEEHQKKLKDAKFNVEKAEEAIRYLELNKP